MSPNPIYRGGVSPNPSYEVEISDLRLSFQRVLPINIMYFFFTPLESVFFGRFFIEICSFFENHPPINQIWGWVTQLQPKRIAISRCCTTVFGIFPFLVEGDPPGKSSSRDFANKTPPSDFQKSGYYQKISLFTSV